MGTSLMLLMEIQSLAKKHGIVMEGEAVDLSTANGVNSDIIVASKEIAGTITSPQAIIIPIQNIIDKHEIEEKVLPILKDFS